MRMRSYFALVDAQEGPRVGGEDGEARVVAEAEVAASDGGDGRVDLDAVDAACG